MAFQLSGQGGAKRPPNGWAGRGEGARVRDDKESEGGGDQFGGWASASKRLGRGAGTLVKLGQIWEAYDQLPPVAFPLSLSGVAYYHV